jgi:DNA-binding transcriptional regulator WhiA
VHVVLHAGEGKDGNVHLPAAGDELPDALLDRLFLRREVRATANRLANFDDANLRRSAQAAVASGARVERALEILGDDIPDHLAYAGRLRLEHKQASLDELGHLSDPPMTKDAIAGRIRRLLAMADKRAEDLGIPATDAFLPDEE